MKSGFLFINKEKDLTSRKVCNQISFNLNEKKVGHIGTLDPFATGLLIVTVGKANKAGAFLEKMDKTYVAELKLGEGTDTGDLSGNIVLYRTIPTLDSSIITNVLNSFIGSGKQIPPMTSAIHVNGTKLYKLAHKGIEVEREARDIFIRNIKLISFVDNVIKFECSVSSGTYIRVLAEDIAKKLGTVGHLISLQRTEVGPFDISGSILVKDVNDQSLIHIGDVLEKISDTIIVDDDYKQKIMNGTVKTINNSSNNKCLFIKDKNNNPIAMYAKIDKDKFEFKRGLF